MNVGTRQLQSHFFIRILTTAGIVLILQYGKIIVSTTKWTEWNEIAVGDGRIVLCVFGMESLVYNLCDCDTGSGYPPRNLWSFAPVILPKANQSSFVTRPLWSYSQKRPSALKILNQRITSHSEWTWATSFVQADFPMFLHIRQLDRAEHRNSLRQDGPKPRKKSID